MTLCQPGGSVDIVRGKVFYDAHVRDARGKWPLPSACNLVNVAEVAPVDAFPQALQSRVVALNVTYGSDETGAFERFGDSNSRLTVYCEWLFNQRMYSGFRQR
jgi:hypothetical protein